jgi:hypothetical protein
MGAARLSSLVAAFRGRIGVTTVARSLALTVLMEPVNARRIDGQRGRSFNDAPRWPEIIQMADGRSRCLKTWGVDSWFECPMRMRQIQVVKQNETSGIRIWRSR